MKPDYWDTAAKTLARRDPVLRKLRARFPDIALVRRYDAFTTLARAITGQQISVKAAETVWSRVVVASGGKSARLKPTIAELRGIGATWTPWRSVATWYLWRSLEPEPVQY